MNLRLFVSCWGNEVDLAGAVALAREWQADGVEGPPPHGQQAEVLRASGLPWIAEVATGGGYVPRPHLTPAQHLDDLRRLIEASLPLSPVLVNALAGSDAWPFRYQVLFFEQAMDMGRELGVQLAIETHRSRPTFSPWSTRDLLQELPDMRVTCDFSHWCAVCERLVMDEEPELLNLIGSRALHIHARVGYAQGPQVPDPRAPEYGDEVEAHLRWWQCVARQQSMAGRTHLTMTPEFGPDQYLHLEPFTQRGAADLREVNHWMLERVRSNGLGMARD